ncbi:MAG: hypothetical protein AAB425_08535 [Bdellovibrionota bacterium]
MRFVLGVGGAAVWLSGILQPIPLAFATRCTRLDPGEAQVISGYRGTQVYPDYTLERVDRYTYRAWVDLRFTDAKGLIKASISKKYESLVRNCFAHVSETLIGPGGTSLQIGLWKDAPIELLELAPPTSDIKINRSWFFRSNSEEWESNANCPLIIHETMHLLGLVDEYVEYDRHPTVKRRTLYDCRAFGPTTSVMYRQSSAFQATDLNWFSQLLPGQERESLLYTGQFKAIVEPGCTETNALYYSCARNAYQSSDEAGNCPTMPSECASPDWVGIGSAK